MIRTTQILFWFGLSIAAGTALYHTSDRTHALERQLRETNNTIEAEQQNIHVLKAEWAYLVNPTRVEASAKRHLPLRPMAPAQVVSYGNIADALTTAHTDKPVAVANARTSAMKVSIAKAAPIPTAQRNAASRALRNTAAASNRKVALAAADRTEAIEHTDEIGSEISTLDDASRY